jgi:hypothetical protein
MSDIQSAPRISTFIDPQTRAHVAVLAITSEEEFAWAQVTISDLSLHDSYQDWLDSREGFQIGLSVAGVDVRMVRVELTPFLVWCRLTRTQPSERTLDSFAMILFFLRRPPAPAALAVVRREDFEAHAQTMNAFAPYADFESWHRHRALVQEDAEGSGVRVEPLAVHVGDFVEWGKCVSEETSEATLDRYASLVLEFLIDDQR